MKSQGSNIVPLFQSAVFSQNPPHAQFAAVIRLWMEDGHRDIKQSTRAAYGTLVQRHILPALGHLPLHAVTAQVVSDFIEAKMATLAPSTVRSISSVLRAILEYAGDAVPARPGDAPRPPLKQREARLLSEAEQARLERTLLAAGSGPALGVLLSLYTGLRLGELCALRWGNLDAREGTLRVAQTVQRIRTGSGTQLIFDRPKSSSSVRRIPLPPWLLEVLEVRRGRDECWLLTGRADRFMEPRTLQNHFKRLLAQAGVEPINFHALRHTFATNCVEQGFDAKTLSCILGHSSVNLTLNTYVHPPLSAMRACMARLAPAAGSCL